MTRTLLSLALPYILISQSTFAAKHDMPEPFNPPATAEFIDDAAPPAEPLTLWYRKPATRWETEALPIGNGRLAGMVFGGVNRERIQLNEETLWDGEYIDRHNPEALKALPEVQRLLFEGKNKEAKNLAAKKMMGKPHKIKSYQTLGDLVLDFPDAATVSGYRRDLDLTTGIARTRYKVDGVSYTRDVFVSQPDQVMVIHITANQAGKIDLSAQLDRQDVTVEKGPGNRLIMKGKLSISYEAQVLPRVKGGTVSTENGKIVISGADEVTLFLNAATSYKSVEDLTADATARCEKPLQAVWEKNIAKIRADHIADHQSLFKRVELDLGTSNAVKLPTDERLRAIKKGAHDPQFETLYFQFGRYLLMSSSRNGYLPANLQGKWSQYYDAPWNSDYHFNINFQMNYWPAQIANLSECHLAYFDYVETLVPYGKNTAQKHYGADGWTLHHLSDIYGKTTTANFLKSAPTPS